ncbi:TonB family protein [Acinetobacter sp. neg1]|uniref:TonB family protein n=1 Tax=Acinetobacter sp. neg1 TaxID=1561068 RepID=UPI0006893E09|nr:TonB family protein [Acinetobacter sp. neg1]
MEKILFASFILCLSGCANKHEKIMSSNSDLHLKSKSYVDVPTSTHVIPATAVIYWLKVPSLSISAEELAGKDRLIIVDVEADNGGYITKASIKRSSGLVDLDQKVLASVKVARLKPHKVNGKYLRFKADLPFEFTLVNSSN